MLLLASALSGFAQGFVNLDFENAALVSDPASPYYPNAIYASGAIPGWTAFIGGVSQTDIFYNTQPLSNAGVCLFGTNGSYQPIQGSYFVILQGSYNPNPNAPLYTNSAAIGQTGLIPITAQSLVFWGNINVGGPILNNLGITFNGQNIAFSTIGSGANYLIYSADISTFAGQSGQLLFNVPFNGNVGLDNIQFSSTPVPEPGVLALFALGGLLLGFRRWNK
jgi:hypothetical protein